MDLEREYSPSSRAGGSADPWIADWERRSSAAGVALGDRLRTTSGGSWVVVADAPSAPLFAFVHGGYWQALSAAGSTFLAPAALAAGHSFASLEYPLAPSADLPTMIAACRAALAEVVAATRPSGVVLVGHSAGAHLAAMVALTSAPPVPVRRLVLLSGVYDLRPLLHTTVNEPLGLDPAAATAASPMLLPCHVPGGTDVVVAWGDHDTEAFIAQSRMFAARLGATALECVGRHHFDVVDDLVDPARPLGALTLAGGTTAPGASAPG